MSDDTLLTRAEVEKANREQNLGVPDVAFYDRLLLTVDAAAKNQREHDLVRQQRVELYTDGLITREEYDALATEHGGVQRLEDYDRVRAKGEHFALRLHQTEAERDQLLVDREADRELVEQLEQMACAVAFETGRVEVLNAHARKHSVCAYCGNETERTPEAMEAHARTCEKHPLSKALAQLAALREALDRDQTGLAAALNKIITHVKGFAWLLEGRGSYEWDDDRYREEAGHAMRPVIELATEALAASGAIANSTLASTAEAAAKRDAELVAKAKREALEEALSLQAYNPDGFSLTEAQQGPRTFIAISDLRDLATRAHQEPKP